MPLNLNAPITTVLDKVRVEQFTVSPQLNTIMIHYSIGTTDENGLYVPREYSVANFQELTFDPSLYESVKTALYALLGEKLNNSTP